MAQISDVFEVEGSLSTWRREGVHSAVRAAPFLTAAMTLGFLAGCDAPLVDTSAIPVSNAMDELEPVGPAVDAALAASDLKTAHDLLLPYAEAGNHEAEFSIGLFIFWDSSGQIFAIDQSEREHRSMSWIREAAGHGNERAVRQMYSAYERGRYGLPKSGELEECWRGVVAFRDGVAFSDLSLAAICMDADAHLFR